MLLPFGLLLWYLTRKSPKTSFFHVSGRCVKYLNAFAALELLDFNP